jgi:hypothetical protein
MDTVTADKIRSLNVLNHVDFMVIGDPIRSLFLSSWGTETQLPDVYQNIVEYKENPEDKPEKVILNIWNLSDRTDATYRMFPLDGTENTGFDYAIIVYDAITRKKNEDLGSWVSIKDQVSNRQHPSRKCGVVALLVKTSRTEQREYQHIIDYCNKNNINLIMVDNNKEDLSKMKDLPHNLSTITYTERKKYVIQKVREILQQNHFPIPSSPSLLLT